MFQIDDSSVPLPSERCTSRNAFSHDTTSDLASRRPAPHDSLALISPIQIATYCHTS